MRTRVILFQIYMILACLNSVSLAYHQQHLSETQKQIMIVLILPQLILAATSKCRGSMILVFNRNLYECAALHLYPRWIVRLIQSFLFYFLTVMLVEIWMVQLMIIQNYAR